MAWGCNLCTIEHPTLLLHYITQSGEIGRANVCDDLRQFGSLCLASWIGRASGTANKLSTSQTVCLLRRPPLGQVCIGECCPGCVCMCI